MARGALTAGKPAQRCVVGFHKLLTNELYNRELKLYNRNLSGSRYYCYAYFRGLWICLLAGNRINGDLIGKIMFDCVIIITDTVYLNSIEIYDGN